MDREFLNAFTDIIKENVAYNEKVDISGLGTFKLQHVNQYQEQHSDGRVVMKPPKDVIRFSPEKSKGNEH